MYPLDARGDGLHLVSHQAVEASAGTLVDNAAVPVISITGGAWIRLVISQPVTSSLYHFRARGRRCLFVLRLRSEAPLPRARTRPPHRVCVVEAYSLSAITLPRAACVWVRRVCRQSVHRARQPAGPARVIRLNYSGGSSVFICRGLGLHGAHRCKAGQDMSSQPSATGSLRRFGVSHRTLWPGACSARSRCW